MRISLDNSSPDFSRSVNNIPPIDTQRATTQVLVGTGETTVIGGIYVSREQTSQDRTPGLHRLPLLGWLFKRNEFSDESRELLIFITPKIGRLQERNVTRTSFARISVLGASLLALASAGCGEFVRGSRSPSQVVVISLEAASGADPKDLGVPLSSDVVTNLTTPDPCSAATPCPTFFND